MSSSLLSILKQANRILSKGRIVLRNLVYNDCSTQSLDPEALEGKLTTGRIQYSMLDVRYSQSAGGGFAFSEYLFRLDRPHFFSGGTIKKGLSNLLKPFIFVARQAGFEPATYGFVV